MFQDSSNPKQDGTENKKDFEQTAALITTLSLSIAPFKVHIRDVQRKSCSRNHPPRLGKTSSPKRQQQCRSNNQQKNVPDDVKQIDCVFVRRQLLVKCHHPSGSFGFCCCFFFGCGCSISRCSSFCLLLDESSKAGAFPVPAVAGADS